MDRRHRSDILRGGDMVSIMLGASKHLTGGAKSWFVLVTLMERAKVTKAIITQNANRGRLSWAANMQ